MWKSEWKMSKEKWLLLLVCGVILLILSFPVGGKSEKSSKKQDVQTEDAFGNGESEVSVSAKGGAGSEAEAAYEAEMEKRVKEILKNVEGVGTVDVMITLKSSGEKVIHVDKDKSRSSTEEKDSAGGQRSSMTEDIKESALMTGNSTAGEPVVEKELQPEISGIVISAAGGGSSVIKAEISEAMEALFNIPAHKIKVLKRVE